MECKILSIFIFLSISIQAYSQRDMVNPVYIRTQIGISLAEHDRQVQIKQKTAGAIALEETNTDQHNSWKKRSEEILERLSFIEFTLSSLPVAWKITDYTTRTKNEISSIISIVSSNPSVLLRNESLTQMTDLLEEVEMNTRLLIGLIVSTTDVFQMELADRKKMLNYVVDEFQYLFRQTRMVRTTLSRLITANRWRRNPLRDFINKDKEKFSRTIENILNP